MKYRNFSNIFLKSHSMRNSQTLHEWNFLQVVNQFSDGFIKLTAISRDKIFTVVIEFYQAALKMHSEFGGSTEPLSFAAETS